MLKAAGEQRRLCLYQVWAVGEDRGLYFRMGVTPSEPSGSGWIPVSAQWGSSKGASPPRSVPESRSIDDPVQVDSRPPLRNRCKRAIGGPLPVGPAPVLSCSDSDSEVGPAQTRSAGENDTPVLEAGSPSVVSLAGPEGSDPPPGAPKPFIPASDSFINSLVSDRGEAGEPPPAPVLPTPDPAAHDLPWMNVDLEGAEAARGGREARGGPALETLETSRAVGEADGPVWTWISGGGCEVDAESQISWLSPTGTRTGDQTPPSPPKCASSPPGPLTSSLSLTPVQTSAWSEQRQQERREEISRKPLERSSVRAL